MIYTIKESDLFNALDSLPAVIELFWQGSVCDFDEENKKTFLHNRIAISCLE